MRDLNDEKQVTENGPNTETDEAQIKQLKDELDTIFRKEEESYNKQKE